MVRLVFSLMCDRSGGANSNRSGDQNKAPSAYTGQIDLAWVTEPECQLQLYARQHLNLCNLCSFNLCNLSRFFRLIFLSHFIGAVEPLQWLYPPSSVPLQMVSREHLTHILLCDPFSYKFLKILDFVKLHIKFDFEMICLGGKGNFKD